MNPSQFRPHRVVQIITLCMLCYARAQFEHDHDHGHDHDHSHHDHASSSSGVDSRRASESDSFNLLRKNVLSVLQSLPSDKVSDEDKVQLMDAFEGMFRDYESKRLEEFQPAEDKTRRLPYGKIHRLAHVTIDNLDISPAGLQVIHRSIHWAFTNSYSTNFCFRHFSANHTGCLEKDGVTGSPKIARGLQEKDKTVILDKHNEYREELGSGRAVIKNQTLPEAAAMARMAWDDELAYLAQAWADQCVFGNDCDECRRTDRLRFVGQNLVRFKGFSTPSRDPDWIMAVDTWAQKGKESLPVETDILRNFTHNDSWAPYTQMVWDFSYLVGCGYSMYKDNFTGKYEQLYVCNYGPAGNVIGTQVYQMGPACSNCPRSHRCDMSTRICTYGEEEKPPAGFVQRKAGETSMVEEDPESSIGVVEVSA